MTKSKVVENAPSARVDNTVDSAESAAEWVPIERLKPWAENPRRNDGEPVDRVAASIKRLGFGAPIVARKNGEIIAGHTRWKAAQLLGLDRVPVRFLDLDPADARMMALADNRLGEVAEWDDAALMKLLDEMTLSEVKLAGWTPKDLERMADDVLGGNDEGPASDESDKLDDSFAIVIECSDEAEQLSVLAECEGRGWKCRALT